MKRVVCSLKLLKSFMIKKATEKENHTTMKFDQRGCVNWTSVINYINGNQLLKETIKDLNSIKMYYSNSYTLITINCAFSLKFTTFSGY